MYRQLDQEVIEKVMQRKNFLYEANFQEIFKRTDNLFAICLIVQWLAISVVALVISPKHLIGESSQISLDIGASIGIGLAIIAAPLLLIKFQKGKAITRHAAAIAQMLLSALLIHLTGGRVEAHFYVFASLALLALYRDWTILLTASLVVALEHLFLGAFFPKSVFGVLETDNFRWVEHMFWIALEDAFLILSCRQSIQEMQNIAQCQAELEEANHNVETQVQKRTLECNEAQEVIKLSEQRLKSALEGSEQALWEWDIRNNKVFYDQGWIEFLGWNPMLCDSERNILGKPIHPDDKDYVEQTLLNHLQGLTPLYEVEYRLRQQDGNWIWLVERGRVSEWNEEQEPTHMVGTAQNITARKEVEEELQQAKQNAEDANQAKSQFLANMSHEIRTPLNGVIGMASLLRQLALTTEQSECVQAIHNSGESLLSIINDILDFAKIEAGKLVLNPAPFNLQSSLEELKDLFKHKAEEKCLKFAIRCPQNVPAELLGDSFRINQVIVNLLSNAFKFTSHGHVYLLVECTHRDDQFADLKISVEDTGIGIQESKLEHIFEKFTQADYSTTRKYGGSGLGLAICKDLVESMGGKIGAHSQSGKGSDFWFTLRLPIVDSVLPESDASLELANARICVVDHKEINCKLISKILTSWNIEHKVMLSETEALETMRQAAHAHKPFDIVIFGDSLFDLQRDSLIEVIKKDSTLKSTILVLLTSSGNLQKGSHSHADFAACLIKPITASALMDALATAWELHKHPSESVEELRRLTETSAMLKRILLVEDHITNQVVTTKLLNQLGFEVDVANDGKEALESLRILQYDLILMDCQMPEMDGFQTTQEIRLREKGQKHIPIIALTANALAGDREKCLSAGMDDYLAKPVSIEQLSRILNKWILKAEANLQPVQTALMND